MQRANAARIQKMRLEIVRRTGMFIVIPCTRWTASELARVERELRICAAGGSLWLRSWQPWIVGACLSLALATVGVVLWKRAK